MRVVYLFATVVLIGAAIWFAPRAGPPPAAPEPAPDAKLEPSSPAEPLDPDRPPGYCDLSKVYDLLPRDELSWTYPDEAAEKIREFRDMGWRWVTPEVFEHASRLLLETIDHTRRLRDDRAYRDAWRVHTNVRLHPVYGRMTFVVEGRSPWVLYVQQGAGAEEYAARAANWLDQLSMAFRAAFDLPPIANAERASERVLKAMVFDHQDAFLEFYVRCGEPKSRETLSCYDLEDRWSRVYREDGLTRREEARRLLHTAFYQLLQFHSKLASQRARPDKGEVLFSDRRLSLRSWWCQEGLARLFSVVTIDPDGKLVFFRVDPGELSPWKESRRKKSPEWEFADLLRVPNGAMLRRRAFQIGLIPDEVRRLTRLFCIQSLALTWFFRETKDEEIRAKYRAYLALELSGEGGYPSFKRVWGKKDDDWSELEKKFEAWLAGVWKEK
jgi:hypothetical protein